jgi:hypothetical protein
VSVINGLAHRLTRILRARDPLCGRVHLKIPAVAGLTLAGVFAGAAHRFGRRRSATSQGARSNQSHG